MIKNKESYLIGDDRIGHRKAIDRIAELSNGDKKYEVIIKPYRKKRTLAQNSLCHLWIGLIAKEVGYSPEFMKDIIKYRMLGPVKIVETEQGRLPILPKTRYFNISEMSDFIEKVEQFAITEVNMTLPQTADYFIAMGAKQ